MTISISILLLFNNIDIAVGDFGSSRLTAAGASAMTANVGTAQWSAPELLMGADDYGCEVDVYSFGILLWELFSGAVCLSVVFVCKIINTNGTKKGAVRG